MKILYIEKSFAVVEKSSGLLSVPGRLPQHKDSVALRFLNLYPHAIPQPTVHRLDMDTSGLLVLAITKQAHRNLSIQFQDRQVKKRYEAVLDGTIPTEGGEVELPFRLDIYRRPYQIYDPIHGKLGLTTWEKLGDEKGRTRVSFFPHTGRTHQLRVHAAHAFGLGTPIVGDNLYGTQKTGQRLLLHAAELTFSHPDTGRPLHFQSPVPF